MQGNRWVPMLVGLVAVVGLMFYGCQEGPFGRQRVVTMSPEAEAQLGAQAFREVLQKEGPKVLPDNRPIVQTVRSIGLRLAKASEDPALRKAIHLPDMEFQWEFKVVESNQVNAFCLPGGKVVVYTGIIPVCKTDAGLATVMGHEIGHALARHGAERMAQERMMQVGLTAAATSLGDVSPQQRKAILGMLGAGANVGILLPFSRSHESEADHIGILLMAKAGYDPVEAVAFWQRMEQATSGGKAPPEFLSTHPSHGRRIEDLRRWVPDAEKFYDRSDKQRPRLLPPVANQGRAVRRSGP
jgi:metalloendopeptidase OMA1, mitochondrial